MPTTSQGIWYPGPNDPIVPLENVFATMASSVDDKMGVRLFSTLADANTAYTAKPFKIAAIGSDMATATLYVRDGTAWRVVSVINPTISSGLTWGVATAWTMNEYGVSKRSGLVTLFLRFTRKSGQGTVTVSASGSCNDAIVTNFPAGYNPFMSTTYYFPASSTTNRTPWNVALGPTGTLTLAGGVPAASFAPSQELRIAMVYPADS